MRGKRHNFWAHVRKTKDCWEWTGCLDMGYGSLWNGRKMERTHRFSYRMNVGKIPKGLHVCHHCDNRKCVRPSHLFVGTHTDNMKDMFGKGRDRQNPLRGNSNPDAKLTTADVRNIRKAYRPRKITYKSLALKYGVSLGLIFKVVRREAWAHIS